MRVNKKSKPRWKTSDTCVYNCSYHFIWTTKFRRKILNVEMQETLKNLITEKCNAMGWEIKALEVCEEHIHLFISAGPNCAPQFIIGQIKGYTSRIMRETYPILKQKLPTIWTRSYYVDTVGCLREETIKKYVEHQKRTSKFMCNSSKV